MMAALDGECSTEQVDELERALAENDGLRDEWSELNRLKEVTNMMSIRKPPEEVWQDYWGSVYARLERSIAWVLISVGAIVLLSWGIWEVIREVVADSQIHGGIKLALAALLLGVVVLLVSVVREKLFTHRADPYKDIER